jgi:hypothetical protein
MVQIPETSRDSKKLAGVTPTAAGLSLLDDANAAAQRTTLGLGSIATQDSNSVTITGGSVSASTVSGTLEGNALVNGYINNCQISSLVLPVAVADGGTAATDVSGARTSLGLGTIATQNADDITITGGDLDSVSISNSSIDSTSLTNAALSASALSGCQLIDGCSMYNGTVTYLSQPLAITDGGTAATTASGARTNLGLGTAAVVNSPVPVANGGTAGTTVAAARTNLSIAPLYVTTAQAGNASGSGETTLASFAVPGGTLATNGDSLWYEAFGSFAANGNAKVLRVRFGSGSNTLVCSFTSSGNNVGWYVSGRIVRTAAATQKGLGVNMAGTTAGTNNVTNLNHTLSGSGTISMIGASSGTSDILIESFVVGLN